jgi:hypothetical protein
MAHKNHSYMVSPPHPRRRRRLRRRRGPPTPPPPPPLASNLYAVERRRRRRRRRTLVLVGVGGLLLLEFDIWDWLHRRKPGVEGTCVDPQLKCLGVKTPCSVIAIYTLGGRGV